MKQYLLLLFFYLLSVNWAFAQKDAIELYPLYKLIYGIISLE